MLPDDIERAPHAVIKVFVDAMTSYMADNNLFPQDGSDLQGFEAPEEAIRHAREAVAKKFSEAESADG